MCNNMNKPGNCDSFTGTDSVANTTIRILMMELYFSPRLPATHLAAQKLFQNISVKVASYNDCHLFHLFVSGGTLATAPYMDEGDAFFMGNYDFSDVVYHLLEKYADSGNNSTMAACGTLHKYPVVNVDYLYSQSAQRLSQRSSCHMRLCQNLGFMPGEINLENVNPTNVVCEMI